MRDAERGVRDVRLRAERFGGSRRSLGGGGRKIEVRRLGRVSYADGLELQKQLVEQRRAGEIGDQLLLLEHPPVITLGVKSRNDRSHVVATADALAAEGVEVFETGRGGDVTYHGPGQLVGYPILDLKPDRCDVHRFVRDIEEVMIRTAAAFGVTAARIPGLTGAWVGDEKLAAIIGNEPVPRTEVTRKLWDYIRSHNLQDPSNKTKINADDKLKQVFDGREQVTMFEMTKHVSGHVK